jgi:hypothetical protein
MQGLAVNKSLILAGFIVGDAAARHRLRKAIRGGVTQKCWRRTAWSMFVFTHASHERTCLESKRGQFSLLILVPKISTWFYNSLVHASGVTDRLRISVSGEDKKENLGLSGKSPSL